MVTVTNYTDRRFSTIYRLQKAPPPVSTISFFYCSKQMLADPFQKTIPKDICNKAVSHLLLIYISFKSGLLKRRQC